MDIAAAVDQLYYYMRPHHNNVDVGGQIIYDRRRCVELV